MTDTGYVQCKVNNSIAYLEFFNPKSNSLPGKTLLSLAGKISELSLDESVRVILLKSAGDKAFCAGASFDELIAVNSFESGKIFFSGFAAVINAIRKCPKFVVGRIHGKAVGGGVGLAAACDYSFANSASSAKLSEFALGIGPFVVGPAVERKIGTANFSKMSIDADWYNANELYSMGLYSRLYNTVEQMDTELNLFLDKMALMSPEATLELKKMFWQGTDNWDTLLEERAEISGRLVLSEFTKNYIREFKSKSR